MKQRLLSQKEQKLNCLTIPLGIENVVCGAKDYLYFVNLLAWEY